MEHTHLVKAANHEEIGVQITDLGHIHAGLALQRQDTVDTRLDEPGHRAGNIAVGIDEHTGAVFLDLRNQAAVIWQKKFIKKRFGEHGPVVVAHVLRDGHEIRLHILRHFVHHPYLPLYKLVTDAVVQFRVVIKGIKMLFDAEQDARPPEGAVQRIPYKRVAAFVRGAQRIQLGRKAGYCIFRKQIGAYGVIVRFVRDDAAAVRSILGAALCLVGQPELFVVCQAEIVLHLTVIQPLRQSFAVPAVQRFIPPVRPLQDGHPIHRRSVHNGMELFSNIHNATSLSQVDICAAEEYCGSQ